MPEGGIAKGATGLSSTASRIRTVRYSLGVDPRALRGFFTSMGGLWSWLGVRVGLSLKINGLADGREGGIT